MNNKHIDGLKTTLKEKILYGLGDVGSNLIWSFAAAFLTLYYTDSVGINAGIIGTMMFVVRIIDCISDISMGTIIEKTNSKLGKARPWMIIFTIPLAISLILLLNVPQSISHSGKIAYIYSTYIFMAVICYTAVNMSYHSMLPLVSANQQDRNVISTVRTIMVGVTIGAISILTPILLGVFGGEKNQNAWTIVSLIFAILAVVSLFVSSLSVKEKKEIAIKLVDKDKIALSDSLKSAAKNRYFIISVGIFILSFIINGLNGIGIYYARDVLGNANLFGIMVIISSLFGGAGVFLSPIIFKRFGKRNSLLFFISVSLVSSCLIYINPHNPALFDYVFNSHAWSGTS